MSMVTASSASTCTVESAWTVTEPLLTARHSIGWVSRAARGAQPRHPHHPFPKQTLGPLLSHFQHSGTQLPPQGKLEQQILPESLGRTKT